MQNRFYFLTLFCQSITLFDVNCRLTRKTENFVYFIVTVFPKLALFFFCNMTGERFPSFPSVSICVCVCLWVHGKIIYTFLPFSIARTIYFVYMPAFCYTIHFQHLYTYNVINSKSCTIFSSLFILCFVYIIHFIVRDSIIRV